MTVRLPLGPAVLAAGLLMGATGCTDDPAPTPASDLPEGWGTAVVHTPDLVLTLLGADEHGWAALHRGDLALAAQSADPTVAARAQHDIQSTRAALLDLHHSTVPELARVWSEHGSIPPGSALHTWAALVAADFDEDPGPLLALAPAPADPAWANVHGALGSDMPEEGLMAVVAERAAGPIGDCLRAHQAVRRSEAPHETLSSACPSPLLVEADGQRTFPDPLALHTRVLRQDAPPAVDDWLAATLFSAAWGPSDLTAGAAGGPTARRLGFGGPAPSSPAEALEQVQTLTRTLDTWRPDASAPGARLAAELDVLGVYRTRLVAAQVEATDLPPLVAVEALRAARDAEAGRTIGPTRHPHLLALEARVAVQAGHYRAALPPLQALAPLSPVFPELPALTELVNDLQVASTLGRTGDSKEP